MASLCHARLADPCHVFGHPAMLCLRDPQYLQRIAARFICPTAVLGQFFMVCLELRQNWQYTLHLLCGQGLFSDVDTLCH
jgi:hypothetical protein